MKCKFCDGMARVINAVYGETTYRKKRCDKCGYTYFTVETETSKNKFNLAMYEYNQKRKERKGKNENQN